MTKFMLLPVGAFLLGTLIAVAATPEEPTNCKLLTLYADSLAESVTTILPKADESERPVVRSIIRDLHAIAAQAPKMDLAQAHKITLELCAEDVPYTMDALGLVLTNAPLCPDPQAAALDLDNDLNLLAGTHTTERVEQEIGPITDGFHHSL